MAKASSEQQARAVVGLFIAYQNTKDEILYPESVRPKYKLEESAPQTINGGIVYRAVPGDTKESDDPDHPNFFNRARSIIVRTSTTNPDKERVPFLEPFWMKDISSEIEPDTRIDDIWDRLYAVDPNAPQLL